MDVQQRLLDGYQIEIEEDHMNKQAESYEERIWKAQAARAEELATLSVDEQKARTKRAEYRRDEARVRLEIAKQKLAKAVGVRLPVASEPKAEKP